MIFKAHQVRGVANTGGVPTKSMLSWETWCVRNQNK